jgi:membrane-anchored glycerophosphoryl diester phosphodiesterase (GDPDase)
LTDPGPPEVDPGPPEAPEVAEVAPVPGVAPVPIVPGVMASGPPPSVGSIVQDVLDALVAAGSELRVLSASVTLFAVAAVGIPLGSYILYIRGQTGAAVEDVPAELGIVVLVAALVGFIALLVLVVQIPLLIIATVGGRVAGQPLTLRQALRRARQVFLRGLGAVLLVAFATAIPTAFAQQFLVAILGRTELASGLTVLSGALFAAPWVYVLPGIVMGGVGTGEAVRRSWRIARFRWRIALTIALLAVVGQVIVASAASSVLGVAATVLGLAGPSELSPAGNPILTVVLLAVGAIVFASIFFGIQIVQFAPQAAGFYALTRYAGGLDAARGEPPEPLFRRPALVFYAVGIVAGLILLANALGQLAP